jgi:hypothetical protein
MEMKMIKNKKNKHIGSAFDEFLSDNNILAEAKAAATKKVLAWQIKQAMAQLKITKQEMAKRMKTSRAVVDRLLDPVNPSLTLKNLERAAVVLHKTIKIELRDIA